MSYDASSLDDYVDVAVRIADFRAKHPDGYLAPADPAQPYRIEVIEDPWCQRCAGQRSIKDGGNWKTCPRCQGTGTRPEGEPARDTFIVYVAAAYRHQDDDRPGIGMAWEPYPGRTPYTRGSELQNAETSAWGRAIIAVGASDSKRGVASREEIRNRLAEHEGGEPVTWTPPANPHTRKADRVRGTAAENNPWSSDNPAPEDTPGSSTPQQWRMLGILAGKAGLPADDARHAAAARILERPEVGSFKELSYNDAIKVKAEFESIIAAEKREGAARA